MDPILGRPPAKGVIVSWSDGFAPLGRSVNDDALQPLLPDAAVPPGPLTAVTRVCLPRSTKDRIRVEIERSIVGDGDTTHFTMDPPVIDLSAEDGERCRQVLDDLAAENLDSGSYEFRVTVRAPDAPEPIVKTRQLIIEPAVAAGEAERRTEDLP